jgi:hypothetical protein
MMVVNYLVVKLFVRSIKLNVSIHVKLRL